MEGIDCERLLACLTGKVNVVRLLQSLISQPWGPGTNYPKAEAG